MIYMCNKWHSYSLTAAIRREAVCDFKINSGQVYLFSCLTSRYGPLDVTRNGENDKTRTALSVEYKSLSVYTGFLQ